MENIAVAFFITTILSLDQEFIAEKCFLIKV